VLTPLAEIDGVTRKSALDIAHNNLLAASLLVCGFATFGVLTALLLCGNGLLVGTSIVAALNGGRTAAEVAAGLVPHGVLEVPGLLIAGMVGFKSLQWCLAASGGRSLVNIGADSLAGIGIAALLITLAAPVEAFITPAVMGAV
jgi:uncharacterized membrane protein SpoIIM required for sporulation